MIPRDRVQGKSMSAIASNTIIETILAGSRAAFEAYEHLSGDHWLGVAPESFLQASIAMAFRDLKIGDDRFFLTLEASIPRILADVDIKIDRRTIKMGDQERFDMLLWRKRKDPRAIIEIKKAFDPTACNVVASRIWQWIRPASSPIEAGYIVAYTSAQSEQTIKNRFDAIKENTCARRYRTVRPETRDSDGSFWDIACFEIRE
jgi:hypothetical protein